MLRNPKAAALPALLVGLLLAAGPAAAADNPRTEQRIEELERKLEILAAELRTLKETQAIPAKRELKSRYGMGPAASKVYAVERGLSIGGYGETNFKGILSDKGSDNNVFDAARLVLYTGYKFNERILFNSEIEFEHASTGKDGEVSVEFAALDFLLNPRVNARVGLVLVPMGFLNEIHEPPFYHGNVRPEVERQIIPSTWRANGVGLFGELAPGLNYRTYLITSLDAKGLRSGGLRGARQSGSKERAEDFSWVGRLDYDGPLPGLRLGSSAYLGNSGQGQRFAGRNIDAFTQIYELHAELKRRGLELRALATLVDIDDAALLSTDIGETIAKRMLGYYGEVAYNIVPLFFPGSSQVLSPWLRYSRVDTQNKVPGGFVSDQSKDRRIIEVGLSYKPIPQVVLKLDYRNQDSDGGKLPDEIRLGTGFVF